MSKEKELLKKILANTIAIMEHLKIKSTETQEKQSEKGLKKSKSKVPVAKKNSPVKAK